MSAIKTPAADAPASEWGRLAVLIPDWRWMRGMRAMEWDGHPAGVGAIADEAWPDPDDPATAGCLLALLGPYVSHMECRVRPSGEVVWRQRADAGRLVVTGWLPLGRVCIAYAAAIGRWPGGGE